MKITIHGPSQSGKSTTVAAIVAALKANGFEAVNTDVSSVAPTTEQIEVTSSSEADRPLLTYSIQGNLPTEVVSILSRAIVDSQTAYLATNPPPRVEQFDVDAPSSFVVREFYSHPDQEDFDNEV